MTVLFDHLAHIYGQRLHRSSNDSTSARLVPRQCGFLDEQVTAALLLTADPAPVALDRLPSSAGENTPPRAPRGTPGVPDETLSHSGARFCASFVSNSPRKSRIRSRGSATRRSLKAAASRRLPQRFHIKPLPAAQVAAPLARICDAKDP